MSFYTLRNRKVPAMPSSQQQRFRLSTQTARVVKLNVLFIFLFCMQVSAKSWSQTVHFTGSNVPLSKVFSIVKDQTGYVVIYNTDLIATSAPVTINAADMPLPDFLNKVLSERALSFSLEDKTIFIRKKTTAILPGTRAIMNGVQQQVPSISGFVRDAKGQLIPGVSIKIKGAAFGTTSNESGFFKLTNIAHDAVVLVSSIGYETLTIPVMQCCNKQDVKGVQVTLNDDGSLLLNVTLTLAVKSLEEIAVTNTGFQEISRERSTGAFSSVSSKELNAQINVDLGTAIEGKAPGLSMYRGEPMVRGVSTFSNDIGTKPLIVLDGLITESTLDMINPYDVETVTVLKDAAAASIYGARAANGVIVINTKQGKRGQTSLSINADYFITEKPDLDKMHYATASQQVDYESDVYKYELSKVADATTLFANYGSIETGGIKYFSPLYDLYRKQANGSLTTDQFNTAIDQLRHNDYFKQFHDLAWQQEVRKRYNLALSTGSEKSNTYFSLNYDGTDKLVRKNTNENVSAYLKSTFKPTSWFSATVGANVLYTKDVSSDSKYSDYLNQPRYTPIVDAQGNRVYSTYTSFSDDYSSYGNMNGTVAEELAGNTAFKSINFNILDALQQGKTTSQGLHLRAFADMNAQLVAGLKYTLKFQYETNRNEEQTLDDKDDYKMHFLYNGMTAYNASTGLYTHAIPYGDRLYQMNSQNNSYSFRNQLDYDKSLTINGRRHDLVALGGFEMRQLKTPISVSDLRYGYDPVTLTSVLLDLNTLKEDGVDSYLYGTNYLGYQPGTTKTTSQHRYVSYYGNLSYTYDYRYSFTGSVRVDQADFLGADPKYRYRPLWSIGGGWNATNEKFLKSVRWIDYLKVRLTYGVNGNVDQSTSPYVTAKLKNDNLFTTLQYTELNGLPNPKLRWEKTATTNLGADFTLLHNFLRGSLDLYHRYSSDLLSTVNLDPTVGGSSQTINNGAMSNDGIELGLSSDWYKTRDLTFSTSIVLAYNHNEIRKVNFAATDAYSYVGSPTNYYYANTPFNSMYAYKFAYMKNGYPVFYDQDGKENITFDGNGVPTSITQINNPKALKRVGTTIPKYNGSIRQSVRYKGFELGAMFAFYGGHQLRKDVMDFSGTDQINRAIADRYTDTHTNTSNPRMELDYPEALKTSAATLSSYYRNSDAQIASATSVRLRNVTLSYLFSQQQMHFLRAHQVKLIAQANNLWLWSKAGDDIDPEAYSLNSGQRNLPIQKTFLFSALLSF